MNYNFITLPSRVWVTLATESTAIGNELYMTTKRDAPITSRFPSLTDQWLSKWRSLAEKPFNWLIKRQSNNLLPRRCSETVGVLHSYLADGKGTFITSWRIFRRQQVLSPVELMLLGLDGLRLRVRTIKDYQARVNNRNYSIIHVYLLNDDPISDPGLLSSMSQRESESQAARGGSCVN